MRVMSRALGMAVVAGLSTAPLIAVRAQDGFMQECRVTTSEKMCECMSAKLPADKRAAAIEGLRKSNAATRPGGNLLDPSMLTQEQMQGLDAVVLAQANCM